MYSWTCTVHAPDACIFLRKFLSLTVHTIGDAARFGFCSKWVTTLFWLGTWGDRFWVMWVWRKDCGRFWDWVEVRNKKTCIYNSLRHVMICQEVRKCIFGCSWITLFWGSIFVKLCKLRTDYCKSAVRISRYKCWNL